MLAKKYKLPIQLFVGKKGQTLKGRHFLFKIFPAEKPFSRFGVIISNKVSKKAADRNRLRRQLFNIFQTIQGKLPIADYLVIIYPSVMNLDQNQLKLELIQTLIPNI